MAWVRRPGIIGYAFEVDLPMGYCNMSLAAFLLEFLGTLHT